MKIIENVTIYKCEYCKKELKLKHAMIKHEEKCLNNPKNHRACMTCRHLTTETKKVWFENLYYDPEHEDSGSYQEKQVFKCESLGKLMYPFKIERSGAADKYPETFEDQEPMPKDCGIYKYHGIF